MKAPVQILRKLIHPENNEGKVTYVLSGSPGDFNITYTASHSVTFQEPHITKKWKRSFSVEDGEFVYLSAQSNTRHSRLKVKIIVNGKVFRESLAEGDYAIATAAGCIRCNK